MPPDLTTYQIHERIMDLINCHTLPNFTPSRLIFRSDRAFLCDIPRGIYVLGPEGVWLNTGQALSAEPGEGGLDIYQISDILSEHISWTYCGEAVPDKANVTSEYAEMLGIPEGIYIPGGTNSMWLWAGDLPKPEPQKHCCEMKRHFILGIVGTDGPEPTCVADFAVAWEPKILIAPKYCGWCGSEIQADHTRRITGM